MGSDLGQATESFYVTGGTLPADANSYIARAADEELFSALSNLKFCYVLNSRQMGKSSICLRTKQRLEETGIGTAFVDLTKIGGRNVTGEQWYAGIALELGRAFQLRAEVLHYWKERAELSPMQRLFGAIRELLLERIEKPLVIFIDEIDATRSLPFPADEFFAAIRECYNRRAEDADFRRLSFCLLGVALPSDLIDNPASTPFNIGERITLKDFSLQEMQPLAAGLPGASQAVLNRIFYWTNGHPFLTQSLCSTCAKDGIQDTRGVDALVRKELLDPTVRESNVNLADVANRALRSGELEADPNRFRADLLTTYEKAWRGKRVDDDESNRVIAVLKLSGMMRSENRRLIVRNRIYRSVFNRAWVRENMPDQDRLRTRRAFYLGVLRTGFFAVLVIANVGLLAYRNQRLADTAGLERDNARYESYVADVNSMRTAEEDNDDISLARLLVLTQKSAYKNLEWWYWFGQLHDTDKELALPVGIGSVEGSADGRSILVRDPRHGYGVYSFPELKPITRNTNASSLTAGWAEAGETIAQLGGQWKLLIRDERGLVSIVNIDESSEKTLQLPNPEAILLFNPSGNTFSAVFHRELWIWNASSLALVHHLVLSPFRINPPVLSGSGNRVAFDEVGATDSSARFGVVLDTNSGMEVDRFAYPPGGGSWSLALNRDGDMVALPTASGRLFLRDIAHHRTIFDVQVGPSSFTRAMFSQSGKRLLTVGSDLVARVWDVGLGKQIYAGKGALDAWLSPDGQTVAISGQGTRLHTVDQPAGDGFTPIKGAAAATCVNGQGELVVSTGEDLRFFQPGSVKEVRRAASGPNAHRSTFTKDGLFRFDFDDRGGADFVKVATGTRTCHLKSCGSRPLPTAFEEDQKIYALDSSRKNLSCYSFDSQIQWTYALESPANGDLVVSPSGGYVAVSCESCKTILISTSSGQEISSFAGPVAAIHSIAFSDDNSRLAVASADHQAYLFRLLVRSATIVCYGHSGEVRSVQFSPDGTRLLTASQDGTARLWDVATGDELLSLGHHGPDLHSAIFNLDGTQIFTSTQAPDGGIRMYTFPVGKMANVIG